MADLQKRAAFSFMQYLDQLGGDHESLLIASQCLSEHFGMDTNDTAQRALYNASGKSLLEIFAAGEKALAPPATTAPTPVGMSTPPAAAVIDIPKPAGEGEANSVPEAEQEIHPIERTDMFQKFMKIAGPKVFKGVTPGSADYRKRYKKALSKFMQRYPDQCLKAEQEAAAAAPALPTATPVVTEDQLKKAETAKTAGNAKLRAKDYRGALKSYTEAITICPDGPKSHIFLGNRATARMFLKDFSGAAEDCRHAIRLNSEFAKNYSRLGSACLRLGEIAECIMACTKCLELDPGNTKATSTLAAAQKMQSDAPDSAANEALPSTSTETPPMPPTGGGQTPNFSNMASMMNDPNIASRVQAAMQNPQLMSMAQQMMQNPQMMNSMMSMFGGGGGGGGGMPDLSAMAASMMGGGAGAGAGGGDTPQ